MGTDCNNSVIGGVLNALDRFALAIAALAQDIELSVKGLEFAIHEADADVLTIVGEGNGVSCSFKLDVKLLLAGWDVPDCKHRITSNSDHFGVLGMHGKTPKLRIKMSSHSYSRGRVAFSFKNFTASGSD